MMMPATSRMGLAAVRIVLALLVLVAIGTQFTIHVDLGFSAVNFFSYFTNLSNLFGAVVLIGAGMRDLTRQPPSPSFDRLRYVSAVNLAIVGVVFALLLRNADLGSLQPWVNSLLHIVVPIAVVIDWFIDRPTTPITRADLVRLQLLPALYLAYVLLRGNTTGWYPYPFLNPANVGGAGGVAVYAVAIAAAFAVAGVALRAFPRSNVRHARH
jgi:hypothetical protein